MTDLAVNLRSLREEKGVSQYQLSEDLNIKRSAYGNYETGISFPEYDVLENIAKYFGVEVKSLLGLNEEFEKNFDIEEEAQCLKKHIRDYFYKKYRKIPSDETLESVISTIVD